MANPEYTFEELPRKYHKPQMKSWEETAMDRRRYFAQRVGIYDEAPLRAAWEKQRRAEIEKALEQWERDVKVQNVLRKSRGELPLDKFGNIDRNSTAYIAREASARASGRYFDPVTGETR